MEITLVHFHPSNLKEMFNQLNSKNTVKLTSSEGTQLICITVFLPNDLKVTKGFG